MPYNNLQFDNTLKDGDVNADFLKLLDSLVYKLVSNVIAKLTKSTDSTTVSITGFYNDKALTNEYTLSDDQETKFENFLTRNNLTFSENNHLKQGNPSYTIQYKKPSTTTSPTTSTTPTSTTPSSLKTALASHDPTIVADYLKNQARAGNIDVTSLNEELNRIKQLIK